MELIWPVQCPGPAWATQVTLRAYHGGAPILLLGLSSQAAAPMLRPPGRRLLIPGQGDLVVLSGGRCLCCGSTGKQRSRK